MSVPGAPAGDPAPPRRDAFARFGPPLVVALTLGLAPFTPEPHLFGKLRWVWGGAAGMGPTDWFDLAVHGTPWAWLLGELAVWGWRRLRP